MIPPPHYPHPSVGDFSYVESWPGRGALRLCYRPLGVVVTTSWCEWYTFAAGYDTARDRMRQAVWAAHQVALGSAERAGWRTRPSRSRGGPL